MEVGLREDHVEIENPKEEIIRMFRDLAKSNDSNDQAKKLKEFSESLLWQLYPEPMWGEQYYGISPDVPTFLESLKHMSADSTWRGKYDAGLYFSTGSVVHTIMFLNYRPGEKRSTSGARYMIFVNDESKQYDRFVEIFGSDCVDLLQDTV